MNLNDLLLFFSIKEDKEFRNLTEEEAFDLFFKILKSYCDNNIKRYNDDKYRALDRFCAKQFLNYMDMLVNETLNVLIDREDFNAFKKYLNQYINLSWNMINTIKFK